MATFLSKLFKPKWQSKNTDTRLEAIEALDINLESDQKILLSLAENDSDLRVRSKVISKLSNSLQLIDLHKKAKADTLPVIEQRLYELANSQSLTLFDLILDIKLLTEMIIKSENPDAFIRGLARIEDPEALFSIATSSKTSKIRQAAAELIESEDQLTRLSASAKSKDKSVFNIVKAKISKNKARQNAQDEQKQTIENLLHSIEEHARTEATKLYEAKFNSLTVRWEALKSGADATQQKRFDIANAICAEKQQLLTKEKIQKEENEKLIQTGGDEQEATLFTLSDTLKRFRSEPASTLDISALDALIKTQETRWLEATRQIKVEKSQIKHYQLLMTELRHYFTALKHFNESTSEIESIISEIETTSKDQKRHEKNTQNLKRKLRYINWPDSYATPLLLLKSQEALGHSAELKQQFAEDAKAIQAKVTKLIEKMDKSLEDRQIKQSHKIHKDIQRLLSQMGAKQGETFHNQLILRVKQLNELRDWQVYASNPRQLELCDAMERLAERNMEPRDKADQIKAMQKEWKSLGGAADQSLWLKFKAASDKAYEPCQAFFDEQNNLKHNNIEKRAKLIEQLTEFIANNDWDNADWKAVETINRQARLEWKQAFPVDFKANKALQNQFNDLLGKLDNYLDTERGKNLALKNDIVEKARSLITLEDLEQAIKQAKALQQDWQTIGITSHKHERGLWQAYREACDQIFARRDQARNERKEEVETSIAESENFCTDIESFAQSANTLNLEDIKQSLSDYRQQYKQLTALPRKALESQQTRFEAALKIIKQAVAIQENKQVLLQWQEVQRKANICRAFYINGDQNISALDESFVSQLKLPKQTELALKSLWISLKAGSLKSDTVVTLDQAKSLCIGCEVAASLDSPEEDKELRMQLQVNRLSLGMSSSNDHQSREEQLNALLLDWYQKVGLSEDAFAPLEQRVEAATKHLLGA